MRRRRRTRTWLMKCPMSAVREHGRLWRRWCLLSSDLGWRFAHQSGLGDSGVLYMMGGDFEPLGS
eukprot:1165062-Pyramimonas_sp.AAC.2